MTTHEVLNVTAEQYGEDLETAFVECYQTGDDVWSHEDSMREATKYLLECLGDQAEQHILDIGAGQGKDAEILLNAGHHVTGIDLYEHEAWLSLHQEWGDKVHFVKAQFTDWQPFPEQKFDVVFDNGCFHHQHPTMYSVYLAHLKALLKPDGMAVFSVFTPLEENLNSHYMDFDLGRIGYCFNIAELQQLLIDNGFIWIGSREIHRPWSYLSVNYLAALVKNSP